MIQIVFALRTLGLNAAKEKLEIVKSRGEAAPNFLGLSRRNVFGLIQEYCTQKNGSATAGPFFGFFL